MTTLNNTYRIMGLSKKENDVFSQSVSLIDNMMFLIPNSKPEYYKLVERISKQTPLTYIVKDREHKVTSVEFKLQNDYIFVTFKTDVIKEEDKGENEDAISSEQN